MDEFWEQSGRDRSRPAWEPAEEGRRCRQCCKLFRREQDLKAHHTKQQCKWREASRTGTRAELAVIRDRRAAAHKRAGKVTLGGLQGLEAYDLKAAYSFKYLGMEFTADGDAGYGMEKRMEQAASRFRQLGRIWHSAEISTGLKLRIYVAGVLSILQYGSECWDITEKSSKGIRAWNARRLALLTGREIRAEYTVPTFDLLGSVRARRLQWAGHLLREKETFLARKVAIAELQMYPPRGTPGGIFQDVPRVKSLEELLELAADRDLWRGLVEGIHKTKRARVITEK